jgi:hypothetical protein
VGQWQNLLSPRPTPSKSDASLAEAVGGRGWGHGGGRPFRVATEKNAKIAEVHLITSRFGAWRLGLNKIVYKSSWKEQGQSLPLQLQILKYLK